MEEYDVVQDPKAVEAGARKWEKVSKRLESVDEACGLLWKGLAQHAAAHIEGPDFGPECAKAFLKRSAAEISRMLQEQGHMVEIGMTWDAL